MRSSSAILCLFFISLLSQGTHTQSSRNPPIYAGTFSAKLDSQLTPPFPGSPTLWIRSVQITAPQGNDFSSLAVISNDAGGTSTYQMTGSFGCANGLLSVSFSSFEGSGASQCKEIGNGQVPGLCQAYLIQRCTGDFAYSTYQTLLGVYELQIHDWCGIQGDVVLTCEGLCAGIVQCSSSLSQIVVNGGTVISNDSTVVINGGNTTMYSNASDITIQTSFNFTLNANTDQIQITLENSSAVVESQANATYLNTGPLRTCAEWLDYVPQTGANFSLSSTPTLLAYASGSISTGDGTATWNVPDDSRVQYVSSISGAAYAFTYCVQGASVYSSQSTYQSVIRIEVANVTSGTPVAIGNSITSLVMPLSVSGGEALLSSACGVFITDQVKPNDYYALYATSTFLNGSSAPLLLAPGATFSLSLWPSGCSGSVNNITFNITVNFANGTLIKGCYYTNITTDQQDGSFCINNEGLVDVRPNSAGTFPDRCLYGTRDGDGILTLVDSGVCAVDANGGTPHGGRISLHSSSTVNVTDLGGGNFSWSTPILTYTGSKCYSLTKSGNTITAGGTGVCSATVNGASASCLSVSVNSNGNMTLTNEGLCGISDTDTVICDTPVGGVTACHVAGSLANITSCANCTNGTLEVERLCSRQPQCQVQADPPQTPPSPGPDYTPVLCFTCGISFPHGGDGGGGGGDSGGSGAPIVPLLPPIVPIGFFPPIVPIFPPTGGSGGGSGGGGGGGPPSVLPILTPLPVGVTEDPVTIGGLQIPPTNFTNRVVFCGASTHGWAILENGTLPETLYICQRLFNGTYAWMPYCTCGAAASNETVMYFTTTAYYNSSSTLYIDSSSQFINFGNTYLESVTVGAGGISSCSAPVHTKNITTAGCGATTSFNDRLALDASFVDVYGSMTVCSRSTRFGSGPGPIFADSIFPCNTTGTVEVAPFGTTVMNDVTIDGTMTVPGALSVTSGGTPSMLNGFSFTTTPPVNPLSPPVCEWTCNGLDEFTATATLSGARAAELPAIDVDGSGTFCSASFPSQKTVTTQTILACDGAHISLNATNIALNGAVSMRSPSISYPSLARASCLSAGAASCSITLNAERGLVRVNVSTNAIGPGSTFDIIISNTFSNFGQTFALAQTIQEDAVIHIAGDPPVMSVLGTTQDTNQLVIRMSNPTALLSQAINSAFIVFFNIVSYS
jgi:hypothetical protein